jgi:Mrr N-terminal domain
MATQKLSRSRELAAKVIFAAFQILKEKGGEAPGRDVIAEVERRVLLDDWAKATYGKSGYVRWQSILHFFSIDCMKAGYLIKRKGVWYLTPESVAAVKFDSKKKALHDPKQKEGRVQQQRADYTEELPTLKAEEVIALDERGAGLNLTLL